MHGLGRPRITPSSSALINRDLALPSSQKSRPLRPGEHVAQMGATFIKLKKTSGKFAIRYHKKIENVTIDSVIEKDFF
jgi:hypothetical protein